MLALAFLCVTVISVNADESFQPLLDALDDASIDVVGIHISGYYNRNVPKEKRMGRCEYCTKCPDFVNFPAITNFRTCPDRMEIYSEALKTEYDYLRHPGEKYLSEYFAFTPQKMYNQRRIYYRTGDFNPSLEHQILSPEMNVTLTKLNVNIKLNQTVQQQKSIDDLSFDDGNFEINLVQGTSRRLKEWSATETLIALKYLPNLPRKTVFLNKLHLQELKQIGCTCIKSKMDLFKGSTEELETLCRAKLKTERKELRAAVKLFECTTKEERLRINGKNKNFREEHPIEL